MIFLDHNSTTNISKAAITKMLEVFALPLNASSIHEYGRIAQKYLNEARAKIKEKLNANNYEVIFTSGASESNNTILAGCEVKNILISPLEHSSILNFASDNKNISYFAVLENGLADFDDLAKKIEKNSLICLCAVNNESGAIQNVKEAAKIAHQNQALIHCDLSQAIGKIKVDVEELNVDFAAFSGHKFGAAQGVGVILVRKGLNLKPLIFGGGQENSKRAGTQNIAAIASLSAALDEIAEKTLKQKEILILRDFLEEELIKIAKNKLKIFASEVQRLPNTSYFAVENLNSQSALINFDLNKIFISSGSACSSGSVSKSRLLREMKINENFLDGALRVSLGIENKKAEIEKFLEVFEGFLKRI
jgi:cysteine desulfurase